MRVDGAAPAAATGDQPRTVPVVMTLTNGFALLESIHAGWVTLGVSTPDVAANFLHYLQGFRPERESLPLTRGTYHFLDEMALRPLCFVPDKTSGIPHALTGMHKIADFRE